MLPQSLVLNEIVLPSQPLSIQVIPKTISCQVTTNSFILSLKEKQSQTLINYCDTISGRLIEFLTAITNEIAAGSIQSQPST